MIENFRSHRNWHRSLMKIWQSKIFVINTIARNSQPIDYIFPRLTEKVCYFSTQQIAEFRDFFLVTEWSISRCFSGQLTNFAISYLLQIGEFHDCFYRDQMTKFTIFFLANDWRISHFFFRRLNDESRTFSPRRTGEFRENFLREIDEIPDFSSAATENCAGFFPATDGRIEFFFTAADGRIARIFRDRKRKGAENRVKKRSAAGCSKIVMKGRRGRRSTNWSRVNTIKTVCSLKMSAFILFWKFRKLK